jgi:tRNA-binding protein
MISYSDFEKVDISIGKIVNAEDFPKARKPVYKLTIGFGPEIGIKKSSVQVVKHYSREELIGKLVMGVVNFFPKQIGPFVSEVLTLGVADENGKVVLLVSTEDVPQGGKIF